VDLNNEESLTFVYKQIPADIENDRVASHDSSADGVDDVVEGPVFFSSPHWQIA
jgi:hypothetical protein